MKASFLLNLTFSSIFSLSGVLSSAFPLQAQNYGQFDEQGIPPENVVAIARPLHDSYDLLVLQQIPNKPQCWQETGSKPVQIDPLLLDQPDFTGNCERATDSDGYSIRINGEDLGLDYLFQIVKRNGELWLIGEPRHQGNKVLVIGRTFGIAPGLIKIFLKPGWQLTKRMYQGKTLGHFYFSTSNEAK